ncbi:hypothetical protein [Lysobacter enzymogenes]|uniref:hypothetical protein n=1 Tax=Lysobacter enzymogenes TaxID=69 RepID=UPI0008954A0C|nr:hypothetical protein [Lysobacter enzymogenes]SDW74010.1 hypothetical protein SAMN05421681_102691 [Lysobacter enzymogenes]
MSNNHALKQLSDEIAAQVHRGQSGDFAQLLSFAKLMGNAPAAPAAAADAPGRIGIWKLDADAGVFSRDVAATSDWAYWAQVQNIPAKSERQRILLLGESVARGMFYDPGYTPAQVLEQLMSGHLGGEAPQVIDLARTNATMATLRRIAEQAEQLAPDMVAIFAGNNWAGNRSYLGEGHAYALLAGLREGGINGLRRKLETILAAEIGKLVDAIAELYARRGVPVCWVLPEFNLGDWRDPKVYVHWLQTPEANERWLALLAQAEAALAQGEFAQARIAAEAMLALDHGDCATTAYVLAACHEGLGQDGERRRYLEMAKDASIVDFTRSYSPRITAAIRRQLLEKAAEKGHRVVDLQQVFPAATGEAIAGKEMFLDYCHLTSQGIRMSMAALGEELLQQGLAKPASLEALLPHAPWPSDADEADAHLLAAIHNAHWGQVYDVVLHYCRRAADKSASVLELMGIIVEIQNERLPVWMNARATELLETVSPQIKRYLFSMEFKCLDRLLLDAFAQCCAEHGIDLASRVSELRLRAHSLGTLGRVDLLDPYYHSTSFSNQQFIDGGVNQRNDFFKGYEPVSEFCFVSDASDAATLRITLKSADGADGAQAQLRINGETWGELALSGQWRTHEIEVPLARVKPGVNRVDLVWPTPSLDGSAQIDQIGRDIRQNAMSEIYPIYGHIYAMEAHAGAGRAALA